MRLLIAGGKGELGDAIATAAWLKAHEAIGLSRQALDVASGEQCLRAVEEIRPDVIVNCAAYHRVDEAEGPDGLERAISVNVYGMANLAIAARQVQAKVVYISTDYVFDGEAAAPYVETDTPNPVNVYGLSKMAGEVAAQEAGVPWLVVRTAGLFGGHGQSQKGGDLFRRLLRRYRSGDPLAVVADTMTSLTYVPDLAAAIIHLIDIGAYGVRHITNLGGTTWHKAAVLALKAATREEVAIHPILQASLAGARRPPRSVLTTRYDETLMPHWSGRLTDYMLRLGEQAPAEAVPGR